MVMIIIIALQLTTDEKLQQAQQMVNAKQYDKAVRLLNEIINEPNPPPVANYLLGMSLEGKQQFKEAIESFAQVISLTDPTKNVHERCQRKMFDLCRANCGMNCAKTYPQNYFPSPKMWKDIEAMYEQRKNLLSSNVDLQKLQTFAEDCRFDGDIQQRILTLSLEASDFKTAKQALTSLRQANAQYRAEINSLIQMLELFDLFAAENYDQVIKTSAALSQSNPDEPGFALVGKVAKTLKESFQLFEQVTPNTNRTTLTGFDKVAANLEKERANVEKAFTKLQKRFSSTIAQVLKRNEDNQQPVSFESMQHKIASQVEALLCGAQYFNQGPSESCAEMDASTPFSKYLKALTMTISLQAEIKNLIRRHSKDEEISEEVEMADRRVAQIHNLLKEIFQAKTDEQFPNLAKFVDDVNLVSDKVFAVQMKVMTPNFYRILNVSKKANASEIKKTYFKLARTLHPDTLKQGATPEEKKKQAAMFQKVALAYDVLSDDEKRRQYDAGNYDADARNQKQANHQSRKERAKEAVIKKEVPQQQFGGFGGGGGQQFFFGGDPFQFMFGGGGQQQQQGGQQQGGGGGEQRQRMRININGQDFFM